MKRLSLVVRSHAALDRVYTVAQVRAGLAGNPRAWVGRTVPVRGTVVVALRADQVEGRGRVARFMLRGQTAGSPDGLAPLHDGLATAGMGNSGGA